LKEECEEWQRRGKVKNEERFEGTRKGKERK
jgi:hypothetical protein